MLYQKRFKKERRFRRKLEHELQHNQNQITQSKPQITANSQQVPVKSSPTPSPQQQQQPQQQTETID